MPEASIIIRAKNEERLIGRALQMVFAQRIDDIEVIVVDSGSTDRTLDIVRQFPVRLVQIPAEAFTFGYSLNVGCGEASSDHLALLSAHAVPCDDNWLSNLLRSFQDPAVAGVWGSEHTWFDGVDTLPGAHRQPMVLDAASYGPHNAVWGFAASNAAIARKVWQEHRFNEKLISSEDKDWAWRAIQAGYKIAYEPLAAVYHEHELTPKQAYWRAWKEHYSYAQVMPDLRFGLLDVLRGLLRPPRRGVWRKAASDAAYGSLLAKGPYLANRMAIRFMVYLGRYQGLKEGRAAALAEANRGGKRA